MSPAKSVRLFIAADLSPDAVNIVRRCQEELGKGMRPVRIRWVRTDQLHLTLKFLGNVPIDAVGELEDALAQATESHSPIQLALDKFGAFPGFERLRVLWIGLNGEIDALKRLQRDIENSMAPFAEKKEDREFEPHLTIARWKDARPRESRLLQELVNSLPPLPKSPWQLHEIRLVKSELRPEGSEYTTVNKFTFVG